MDHGHDRQFETASELEVTLVMCRYGHDGARAVAEEHVVGDPHGDSLLVDGVDGVATGEDAGLLAALFHPLQFGPACSGTSVRIDDLFVIVGRE